MKKSIFLAFVVCFLMGCNTKEDHIASLRFDWVANMNFVGDIYAQKVIGNKYDIQLKCEQAGMGIDPIRMVLSGQNDFGIVSLEQLFLANQIGADLVAIGVINDISPTVFLSKADRNIEIPTDFHGKTVGINPAGATEFVYRAFLNVNKINQKLITEVPVDFDLTSFMLGRYDIRLAFAYIEPLDLDIANIDYNIMKPMDYGLKFPGRVYFTKRETIIKRSDFVQSFINTVAEGWQLALSDQETAIKGLIEFEPQVDKDREIKSFEVGSSYFKGFNNEVLSFDNESILEIANLLVEIDLIKEADFSSMLDDTFINLFHTNQKKE